jgi:SAM-dependent methyltransferase
MADESGFQLKGSAPERYERYAAPFMAPFVEAILDAVDLYPGAKVLDLACGTGFAAHAAAARVGPAGRVSGADVNTGMIGVAAEHAPRMYPDIEFIVAPPKGSPMRTRPSTRSCASRASSSSPTWTRPSRRRPA